MKQTTFRMAAHENASTTPAGAAPAPTGVSFCRKSPVRGLLVLLLVLLLLSVGGCSDSGQSARDLDAAREAFANGYFIEAERLYEGYLQTNPEGSERWEAWDRILHISRNVRRDQVRSIDLLEAMILEFANRPKRVRSLTKTLAETYEASRQWDKAIEAWKRYQDLLPEEDAPGRAEADFRMGRIHQTKTEYDMAQEAFGRCQAESDSPELTAKCLYYKAQTLGYLENWAQAKELLLQAADLEGVGEERRALCLFMLADIYEQESNPAKAVDILESIQDVYPNPKVVETRLKYLKGL